VPAELQVFDFLLQVIAAPAGFSAPLTDLWAGQNAVGLDTGCGSGEFLSAFEWPEYSVYEFR
jgi:hypothetical protein